MEDSHHSHRESEEHESERENFEHENEALEDSDQHSAQDQGIIISAFCFWLIDIEFKKI